MTTNKLAPCRTLLCAVIALLVSLSAQAGTIEYPLFGHFRADAGSIELWFTPMVDDLYPTLPPNEKFQNIVPLVNFSVPQQFTVAGGIIARADGKGNTQHMLHISMSHAEVDKGLLPVTGMLPSGLAPRQPMHMALTWRGTQMQVFLNGQHVGTRQQAMGFPEIPPGTMLTLGHSMKFQPPMVVHALRLSSVARTAEQLRDAAPAADQHTLLLDVLDQESSVSKDGLTTPKVSSTLDGQAHGQASGVWRFVADAPGPGVALFQEK